MIIQSNISHQSRLKELLGCLPKAITYNLFFGVLAIILGIILGGPKIFITFQTALIIFLILMIFYLFVTIWSIISLPPSKMFKDIVTGGPYRYVRHPTYSAIIFILNPALAVLLRSWLLLIACLPIYFVWRKAIEIEERILIEKFGKRYSKYFFKTFPLFPNLLKINKILFFGFIGVIVFILTFIVFNFPSFYLRFVEWGKKEKLVFNEKVELENKELELKSEKLELEKGTEIKEIKYNEPNSILVNKINLRVPLIFSQAKNDREINQDLNQGVIIYPGSVLPGEIGNLFLAGHSSVYPWIKTSYGQVFVLLDQLEKGDRVNIFYQQRKYEYEIENKYVISPKEAKIVHSQTESTITLMTCWPIGTTWKRLIVEGRLKR